MEQENLEEGRGKKGQARQAGRTQDDEWGAKERLKKSFRNYADKRKSKTSHLDEGRDGSGMDLYIRGAQSRVNSGKAEDFGTALHQTINSAHSDKPADFRSKLHASVLNHVKARNRPGGVKEDVEQIDELSKKTLGNYVKAAAPAAVNKAMFDLPVAQMGDNRHDRKKNITKIFKKLNNREAGINRAVNKLTKEDYVDALTEEGLQAIEIGINEYFLTLGEEVDQETFDAMVEDIAANLVSDLTEAEEAGSILEFNNKETKKTKSDIIESVVDKYAAEVEYEEISEEDHIIDVLSKHIHEKQIEKVLDLYDSLDEENREELIDLIETKEGINEVINFIIEDSKTSEEE